MKPWHLIALLVMNFFWGAVYPATKLVGHDLETGGIVTIRFTIAALSVAAFWPWLPGTAPKGKDLVLTCLMGVMLFVVGQRLQVYGNNTGSAGNTSVLMGIEPLLTSVGSALFLHEHIGPRRIAGFGLAMAGIVLINDIWSPEFKWSSVTASVLVVLSFVCESAYSIMSKPIVQRAGVIKMLAISLLAGTAVNLAIDGPATLSKAGDLPVRVWALLAGLAIVCTVVGSTVWLLVVRECPVNVVALTIFAQPVVGLLLSALWLGEKLRWGQLAGGSAIIAGMALGLSRQMKQGGRN